MERVSAILIVTLASATARANADDPWPELWALVADSEQIVVGDVRPAPAMTGEQYYLSVDVDSTLKGRVDRVVVFPRSYDWTDIGAGDAMRTEWNDFKYGAIDTPTRMILFFARAAHDAAPAELATWGALPLAEGEDAAFAERIGEALELQQRGRRGRWANEPDARAWLAGCIARRATRGLCVPEWGRRSPTAWFDFAADERVVIAEGFAAEPSADATIPLIVEIVGRTPSDRLDAALATTLEGMLNGPWPDGFPPGTIALAYPAVAARLEGSQRRGGADWSLSSLRRRWESLKGARHVSPVVRADIGHAHVRDRGIPRLNE